MLVEADTVPAAPPDLEGMRIEVLHGSAVNPSPTCVTFVLYHETHTFGNALRWMIQRDSEVEFCGYTIPHPSEPKLHLRIQTYSTPAIDVLERALDRLESMCDIIDEKFKNAVIHAPASAHVPDENEVEA